MKWRPLLLVNILFSCLVRLPTSSQFKLRNFLKSGFIKREKLGKNQLSDFKPHTLFTSSYSLMHVCYLAF